MRLVRSLLTLILPIAAAAAPIDFNRDVRPILSEKCFHCHGPDEGSRKAKLRLDIREEALKERDGVRAVAPGKIEESELVTRITSSDPDELMPPPKEHSEITKAEIDTLRRWVSEGAPYAKHWSFEAPKRPTVLTGSTVQPETKVQGAIDAFISAELSKQGLKLSPEVDRATLIRRVSLDLIGLPPTPAEVAAFVDDKAPDAYDRAVDRLLASPHFGERWARMWMDCSRYADSTGYGSDKMRPFMWPWRDWVIAAFNRNMPYDQFTIEQLAGDLLPKPTQDQILATTFNRNTMTNVEGGTIDEEYRVAAVKDRVSTTMQVWMGLTAGCAQCHSHKFDPISQKDYYSLFAVFNQTEDNDREDEEPRVALPTAEELKKTDELNARIAKLNEALKATPPELEAEFHEWEAKMLQPEAPEDPEKPTPALPAAIKEALSIEPSERSPQQREALLKHFRPLSRYGTELNKQLTAAKTELAAIKPVRVPIMRELAHDKQRKSFVFNKGNYLLPGDEVKPALLKEFPPAVAGEINRLKLAQWITSPENPLTARVAANRFWAQMFGKGLVETEEDFGTQGALPSHPELLDWLAVEFRESGWDVKHLLKLIVSSATYRQTSKATPELLQKDPVDRLLSRYPRRRLGAEEVRDQALAVSGLLSPKLGGPSVYPPQPNGLWRVAFNGGSNSEYKTSTGEDRWRRGLYTVWRRTMPNPTMVTFDAPSRETCTVRRIPTNTPLQAFVTLNDPVFVECAQALARRIMKEGGADSDARIRFALNLCLGHPADAAQVTELRHLYDAELLTYQQQPNEAAKLATQPLGPLPSGFNVSEAAAWTSVANVLLNLDGFLSKN